MHYFCVNKMLSTFFDYIERMIRWLVVLVTNILPVKVIRDERGVPFLYRYHILALTNDGPGICIHHFVKSDPDRGYHDHPWNKAVSLILCGGYSERILKQNAEDCSVDYYTKERKRWRLNWLNGKNVYHRVILDEEKGEDAWTLFFFQKRSKVWNMISLDGEKKTNEYNYQ